MNRKKAAGKGSRKTSSSSAEPETKKKSNPRDRDRDPLKDLNGSSSISVEAPRGCFRFLLSNPSSKTTLPRTPKSAPNARTLRKDPPSSNLRSRPPPPPPPFKKSTNPKQPQKVNNPDLFQSQSPSLEGQFLVPSKAHKQTSELTTCRQVLDKSATYLDLAGQSTATPLKTGKPSELSIRTVLENNGTPATRLASWSCLVSTPDKILEEHLSSSTTTTTTTTTPPVQASISPEIQCGSSTIYTPACYGAGHVVVGVTDKRKCRPRGILTVGEEVVDKNLGLGISNGGNDTRVSLVPAPAEACVDWLASPRNDTGSETGSPEFVSAKISAVPILADEVTTDRLLSPCDGANGGNGSPKSTGTFVLSTSISVAGASHCSCKLLTPQHDLRFRYDPTVKNSPFSGNSWGSPNLVTMPLSDSSSNIHFGLSSLNMEDLLDCQLEANSVAEVLPTVTSSPQSCMVTRDPTDILPLPGLSFNFSFPNTPYNSNDGAHFQMPPYDQTFRGEESCQQVRRMSTYTSLVRISWREGLVSRIFDMDESDCCRWLSEEEDDNYSKNDHFKSDFGIEFDDLDIRRSTLTDENDRRLTNGFGSPEFLYDERSEGKGEVKLPPHGPVSCAESISTEGSGLVASGDSDWTLCYKNHLFEV